MKIRRNGNRGLMIRVAGVAAASVGIGLPLTASAADYPPSPGGDPSISIQALAPTCIVDAPYIRYVIATPNLQLDGPATLHFTDSRGTVIDSRIVNSRGGVTPFPGASVAADGTATDWPGWKVAEDGVSWIHDSSDSHWRDGLQVEVEMGADQSAHGSVSYPEAGSGCEGPTVASPPEPGSPESPIQGVAAPNSTELPSTGGDSVRTTMMIAFVALAVGTGLAVFGRKQVGRVSD